MSGIYIKGMEMPKRCEDCFCYRHNAQYDYAYCNISSVNVRGNGNARLNNCPLVAVPDHGGLVDANRLIDIALHLMHTAKNDDIANGAKWLWQYILEAPIIIEAEEGE